MRDEMRFGLWGQVRGRWGLKGLKPIQPMPMVFSWRYLVLAVAVLRWELRWAWAVKSSGKKKALE
jgi:hypothetical protein